ncbi:hypothetical protein EVAR_79019_1 [Eumeta japonica]|uniref:Uncharacterized protein n=1 Tax=Eumeta variegata TaxID=151549 RepID=A0A4C1XUG1_EUMVA|nr:hypothetical protein EVAR_79007_1 [Eumeta japonica]GBP66671.1 hypothetical protein EVAR_79025_1 [Eumeta japonica]GBP66673.1 hypothetical protein EVAR_79027_1 [Eumeta japonica]GBP66675.1 hypothetical protein EVAR_79029_1 [Eumeta japonica]GBP66677.1 hypothetical protein EVAR_79031_1 [Eumeta japonica]
MNFRKLGSQPVAYSRNKSLKPVTNRTIVASPTRMPILTILELEALARFAAHYDADNHIDVAMASYVSNAI